MQPFLFLHLLSLQAGNCVMDLDHVDGKLKIHYSDRLSSLLREVRQLAALGFTIPAGIRQAANTADKFYRQAVVLKQASLHGIHSFIYTFIHSFIHSLNNLCIHLFSHSHIHSFIHTFIR